MISEQPSLKQILQALREGDVKTFTPKDLANYHNGGTLPIPAHNTHEPYHDMDTRAKSAALVRGYRELKLLLDDPPPGVVAEELPGGEFRVRFVRIDLGDTKGGPR